MYRFIVLIPMLFIGAVSAKNGGDFLEGIEQEISSLDGLEDVSFDGIEDIGSPARLTTTTISTDADFLISSDVQIDRYSGEVEIETGGTTIGVTASRTEYDVDFGGFGLQSTNLQDGTNNFSLSLGQQWTDSYSSTLTFSGYSGFTNFRSLWLAEFFEQDVGNAPGFEDPDPSGVSVSLGNTYVFPNEVDSISVNVGYSSDRISPGQQATSLPFPPFFGIERGDDVQETFTASVTGNFYLTNRVTSQWFVRTSFITERDVRTLLRARAAWQITQDLTLRSEFGATFEAPEFQAVFGGVTLSYQILEPLTLSLGYRIYSDTGEITTSNFNSAAPELDTNEISASLLWSKGAHSVSSSIAFFLTDFDGGLEGTINEPFAELFSDRDFIAVRAAYTYRF